MHCNVIALVQAGRYNRPIMKSGPFMVTGASASGKSTLIRFAHERGGYDVLPTHTTRPLRPGEIGGLDMVSVPTADFIAGFNRGEYLEPDLDFALLRATGVYYGTPRLWLPQLASAASKCAMPTSLTVARTIQEATDVPWVHLECPDDARRQRLMDRGISPAEVEARMTAGESVVSPPEAEMILNTAELSVGGIFRVIQEELL